MTFIDILNILLGIITVLFFLLNIRAFYKIDAKKNNKKYIGLLLQHALINSGKKFDKDIIDFFPISFILFFGGRNDEKWGIEVKMMYTQKYKIEFSFWLALLITGIVQLILFIK